MNTKDFEKNFSSYEGISQMLKTCGYDEIISAAAKICGIELTAYENMLVKGFSEKLQYQYILKDTIKNIARYDIVYSMLSDEKSKTVFFLLMRYMLIPDEAFLKKAAELSTKAFLEEDIIGFAEDEVLADCSSGTDNMALEYIRRDGKYKKIYVYTSSKKKFEKSKKSFAPYENVAVSCKKVSDSETDSSVCLDNDITEPISYIKLDMGGSEISALIGAKKHIKNDKPDLAVCISNSLGGFSEIPLFVKPMTHGYAYQIRHYCDNSDNKTVFYAVSRPKAAISAKKTVKRAVAFPWREGWFNVELTKDCGLIPFLLYKNHGMDVTMVGAKVDDYPYAETVVKGLKMEFLENGTFEEKRSYIEKNAKDIDLLILYGVYDINALLAIRYKHYNPSGKIYASFDANSHWMDRIRWDREFYIKFMKSCDVKATAFRKMQKHLNEKLPYKIEYIPNGYYDYFHTLTEPDFSKKENTILTVARIGAEQKANHIMLEAFAKAADRIPQWKLELVGPVEKGFEEYIDNYFAKYPALKDRVIFTGSIVDKKELFGHYSKAKIFTLSSIIEGGIPNAAAEALAAGCAIAVTKIDAWEEITDYGRCGMAAPINDVSGMADIYVKLCTDPELEKLERRAYEYYTENYDMEKVVKRLEELLFGGDKL